MPGQRRGSTPIAGPFHGSHFVFEEQPLQGGKQVRWAADSANVFSHSGSSRSVAPPKPTPSSFWSYVDYIFNYKIILLLSILLALLIAHGEGYIPQNANGLSFASLVPSVPYIQEWRSTCQLQQTIPPGVTRYVLSEVAHSSWSPRDHALAADGAIILPSLTSSDTPSAKKSASPHPAEVILRDNSHGGRCWMMPEPHGQVAIRLPHFLYPSSITIDHAPSHIADDITQAPRKMRLWGLLDEDTAEYSTYTSSDHPIPMAPPISDTYTFMHLADIEYDIHALQPIQTFQINQGKRDAKTDFGVYVIEVVDNWGSMHTCLYRVRIHGEVSE